MRILFCQESDWLKRNMHQQHHLAELMSLRGHEIRVIDFEIMWRKGNKELYSKRQVFENINKIYDNAKVTLIRPSIIKFIGFDYLSLLYTHKREIDRQIKEFNPDVVVGFSILNSYLAMKSCKKNKIPFIYYWIDVLHELIPFLPFRFIGKYIESIVLKNSDKILVINKKLKSYVEELGASNVEVLSAGVDFKKFDRNIDGKLIRELYKFKDNDIVLFYMGWLYKFSGLFEVIKSMSNIENENIKLLIVGDGESYSDLLGIRDKLNLQNSVFIVGKKPYNEIPHYIASSDVCIMPSENNRIMENIVPIKLYEYLSMGKPIICTRLPAVKEEFGRYIDYVRKPENVVTEAMEKSKRYKNKAWTNYAVKVKSWDEIADSFENILKEV